MNFQSIAPLLFLCALGFANASPAPVPQNCSQVLQVTTKSWDATQGKLQRMKKTSSGKWQPVGDAIPVTIGRTGLAWGLGLHPEPTAKPRKQEGDGKAPAGVFSLGTAFGYAKTAPFGCTLPYRQATENDFFVDDKNSPDYNHWVHLPGGITEAEKRWASYEKMLLPSGLYEFGIVVNHNTNPVVPGAGSAIFLHIWRGPDKPTAGCTAMSKENLLLLLSWLDPATNPVLVQAPAGVFTKN